MGEQRLFDGIRMRRGIIRFEVCLFAFLHVDREWVREAEKLRYYCRKAAGAEVYTREAEVGQGRSKHAKT